MKEYTSYEDSGLSLRFNTLLQRIKTLSVEYKNDPAPFIPEALKQLNALVECVEWVQLKCAPLVSHGKKISLFSSIPALTTMVLKVKSYTPIFKPKTQRFCEKLNERLPNQIKNIVKSLPEKKITPENQVLFLERLIEYQKTHFDTDYAFLTDLAGPCLGKLKDGLLNAIDNWIFPFEISGLMDILENNLLQLNMLYFKSILDHPLFYELIMEGLVFLESIPEIDEGLLSFLNPPSFMGIQFKLQHAPTQTQRYVFTLTLPNQEPIPINVHELYKQGKSWLGTFLLEMLESPQDTYFEDNGLWLAFAVEDGRRKRNDTHPLLESCLQYKHALVEAVQRWQQREGLALKQEIQRLVQEQDQIRQAFEGLETVPNLDEKIQCLDMLYEKQRHLIEAFQTITVTIKRFNTRVLDEMVPYTDTLSPHFLLRSEVLLPEIFSQSFKPSQKTIHSCLSSGGKYLLEFTQKRKEILLELIKNDKKLNEVSQQALVNLNQASKKLHKLIGITFDTPLTAKTFFAFEREIQRKIGALTQNPDTQLTNTLSELEKKSSQLAWLAERYNQKLPLKVIIEQSVIPKSQILALLGIAEKDHSTWNFGFFSAKHLLKNKEIEFNERLNIQTHAVQIQQQQLRALQEQNALKRRLYDALQPYSENLALLLKYHTRRIENIQNKANSLSLNMDWKLLDDHSLLFHTIQQYTCDLLENTPEQVKSFNTLHTLFCDAVSHHTRTLNPILEQALNGLQLLQIRENPSDNVLAIKNISDCETKLKYLQQYLDALDKLKNPSDTLRNAIQVTKQKQTELLVQMQKVSKDIEAVNQRSEHRTLFVNQLIERFKPSPTACDRLRQYAATNQLTPVLKHLASGSQPWSVRSCDTQLALQLIQYDLQPLDKQIPQPLHTLDTINQALISLPKTLQASLSTVLRHLDTLQQHGENIHDDTPKKLVASLQQSIGRFAMQYSASDPQFQPELIERFKYESLFRLHSEETSLSKHRALYKVIALNIAAILFTFGIGLGVIIYRQRFFHTQTKRMELAEHAHQGILQIA